jgi:RHS repeat-associated protein
VRKRGTGYFFGPAPNKVACPLFTPFHSYDNLGRVAGHTHTVNGNNIYSIQLTYDSLGNISRKTETAAGATTTWGYSYDVDGQLTTVTRNGTTYETYGYDVNGNRTTFSMPGSNFIAAFDNQDRIIQQGGTTYQFNADGQLTQLGTNTFQYSARGELLQANVNGEGITYTYDGAGRRVGKTNSTGTYQYLYGNQKKPFQLTATIDPDGDLTAYYYDDGSKLIAFDEAGTRFYVATDQLGSPRVIVDATGNLVQLLEYDPFGQLTFDSDPDVNIPVGFAGGLLDSDTWLVRFGYRDYDPYAGRWTAKDPIFFKGGQGNLFGYVQNNPVRFIDPLGLWYFDLNITLGSGGGLTFGLQAGSAGVYAYYGVGIVDGASVSATVNTGDPTNGLGVNIISTVGAGIGATASQTLDSNGFAKSGDTYGSGGIGIGLGLSAGITGTNSIPIWQPKPKGNCK